ncbi:MAG TPA: ATP-dependent Clp protease ATP-binding subunit [Candidatus Faecicola pullistercoris]|nr:ATP-dependent Clp protease ATP-binding subunit [Candidatus Faecicola pullistercoris]
MKYSKSTQAALMNAEKIAADTGGLVGSEHILCGLLSIDCTASRILNKYGLELDTALSMLPRSMPTNIIEYSPHSKYIIIQAQEIVANLGMEFIGTEHILASILMDSDCTAVRLMILAEVDIKELIKYIKTDVITPLVDNEEKADYREDAKGPFGYKGRRGSSSEKDGVSKLEKFGVDLTKKAKEGRLDPVIGRSKEIERVIQVLCRRTKNNPVLIGEPGVGKSAVIEGLAQEIAENKVPDILKDKIIFSLDLASVIAGTKYRGEFEERFKEALEAIKSAGNIILFIDEIHTIVKAGGAEGAIDAGNILKPMLARGEIQTVGATTIDEYRKHIEADAALERRFQPIIVDQPSVEDTILILKGLKDRYEAHHKVKITDAALVAAANLSDRYITDRFLPDKAIDLIDEAASRKRIFAFTAPQELKNAEQKLQSLKYETEQAVKDKDFAKAAEYQKEAEKLENEVKEKTEEYNKGKVDVKLEIGEEEIAEIVANQTGVPLTKITQTESEKLLNLEAVLKSRVIGQDNAVSAVARAIKRARAGLKDPKRPIGSFIFLGPTGVGKTELSKALAEAMFGDENQLIRIDMSEYMEKNNVSKMIGSAPGYVGFEEGGQLTEKVRRKPYSVVLFDEIEKAHSDVFNIMLQILDDGRLTDSHGRTVNFKNTIIIMTSNIGSSEIGKMPKLGFGKDGDDNGYERMKEQQMEALKRSLKPEFINRIDEIVIFRKLDGEDMGRIADIMLNATASRLRGLGIDIEITPEAKEFIVRKGSDIEYGARPLRRTIQRLVEDKLSEEILEGKISAGKKIEVASDGETLIFNEKQTT